MRGMGVQSTEVNGVEGEWVVWWLVVGQKEGHASNWADPAPRSRAPA